MKIPIIDNVLDIVGEGLEFINSKEERQRKAVVRSARAAIEQLRDVEIPERARHYVDQMEVRLNRLT